VVAGSVRELAVSDRTPIPSSDGSWILSETIPAARRIFRQSGVF